MTRYTLGKTKFKIRVTYRSGNEMTFWTNEFSANCDNGKLERISWKGAHGNCYPLHLGVDDIEAIQQMAAHKSIWSLFS